MGDFVTRDRSSFLIFPPWDILRGRDVFVDSDDLSFETDVADLSHWAPNCATFSRAREIPIPNVKNPPLPLRSDEFPTGIPAEVARMSKRARIRLEKDTEMAERAAERCLERHLAGKAFSLEHPGRSIALELPSWKKLKSSPGVFCSFYHTCMFPGSSRRKHQVLIHNLECLKDMEKTCPDSRLCARTSKPHHKWRPIVSSGRVTQYITGEEREYPEGFCKAYAEALRPSISSGSIKSLVEIYSGPNAPLSSAISELAGGGPLPRVKSEKGKREYQGLNELSLKSSSSVGAVQTEKFAARPNPTRDLNREHAVDSGRQPSFGKRKQLIPDGLNDPTRHLEKARKLQHPFERMEGLKQIHKHCLSMEKEMKDPARVRQDTLEMLKRAAHYPEVIRRDEELKALGGIASEKLGKKLNLGLMEWVQSRCGIEDPAVPLLCSTGMGILGRALESPFFLSFESPQKVTAREFESTTKSRRKDAIRKTEFMSRIGGKEMSEVIWKKTQEEVESGTMGPPLTEEQAASKYGDFYNLIPSFGLRQGISTDGSPKFRRIDDHTAGWVNLAAKRLQKIPMATADYISTMIRSQAEAYPEEKISLATADMKAAYRQVPLSDSDLKVALTCIFNPNNGKVDIHEMFGQPFGAGHAVPNFYRFAEWFQRVVCRLYGIACDHFFDDFWLVSRADLAEHALECVLQTASLLGIIFDPKKTQLPSEETEILGVIFDTSHLVNERVIHVRPKPSRVINLTTAIDESLSRDILNPAMAASIVGKFGFLCSTMYGKVGRCASLGVRARQYCLDSNLSINPPLKTSLLLMKEFLLHSPPRTVTLGKTLPPVLLYTDASDVPGRSPRFGVGGVLIDQTSTAPKLYHFTFPVPEQWVARWIPKETYMGQLEILAGPIALRTWARILFDTRCLHFVDNDSASASLVKGYSPRSDSCELVGIYWLQAAQIPVDIYIDRVESKSNLSDEPSRFSDTLLLSLGSTPVTPVIPSELHTESPLAWFAPLISQSAAT